MMLLVLLFTTSVLHSVYGVDVCYNPIGCFKNTKPYTNSLGKLPRSPDYIKTSFTLHTRQSVKDNAQQLDPSKVSTITASNFNDLHNTVFIVHGFHSKNTSDWIQPLVEALLSQDDMNIIVVDWSGGAFDPYEQAVANIRVVGAVIAELVHTLHNNTSIQYSSVHLIGHSLGAHVCGYAGERVPGLGRITGLDPAGPFFQNVDQAVRIDQTDAVFVDIIHTDGTRYGLNETVGSVDFFPNGGVHQPECLSDYLDPSIACSHLRAVYYFTESIRSTCHFKSYPCQSRKEFDDNQCNSCDNGCQEMGYHVDQSASGSYYLKTNGHYPFCSKMSRMPTVIPFVW